MKPEYQLAWTFTLAAVKQQTSIARSNKQSYLVSKLERYMEYLQETYREQCEKSMIKTLNADTSRYEDSDGIEPEGDGTK